MAAGAILPPLFFERGCPRLFALSPAMLEQPGNTLIQYVGRNLDRRESARPADGGGR